MSQAAKGRQDSWYSSMFEHHPSPAWICDRETGEFLDVNLAAVALYGYSREEFLGMTRDGLVAERDGEGGSDCYRRKDGSVATVLTSTSEIQFQGREASLVIAQDVTALDKLQRISARAFVIAHDFNNQLMLISGYADMLANDLTKRGDMNGDRRNSMEHIQKASARATSLAGELSDLRRALDGDLVKKKSHGDEAARRKRS